MDKFSLRVNAFDLDFNVVNTRHKIIHLDEKIGDKRYPISVRLDAFEQQWYKENLGKNYRFRNDDICQAFIEQSDEWVHGELGLLDDLRQNDHWPSMQKLLQSVCEADPSSIVTARQASEKAIWSLRDRKITLFHTDKKFPSKISIKNHEDQKQTYKSD